MVKTVAHVGLRGESSWQQLVLTKKLSCWIFLLLCSSYVVYYPHILLSNNLISEMMSVIYRCSQGPCPPKFLGYLIFFVFWEALSQAKYCCFPKNKHFAPPERFWTGCTTALMVFKEKLYIMWFFCEIELLFQNLPWVVNSVLAETMEWCVEGRSNVFSSFCKLEIGC